MTKETASAKEAAKNNDDGTPKGNQPVANVPAAPNKEDAKEQAKRVAADDAASRDPSATDSNPTEGAVPEGSAVNSPQTGRNEPSEATPSAREQAREGTATASEAPNANHNTGGNVPTSDVSNTDAPVDDEVTFDRGTEDGGVGVNPSNDGFEPTSGGAEAAYNKLKAMAESITKGTPMDHVLFGYAGQSLMVEDLLNLTRTTLK